MAYTTIKKASDYFNTVLYTGTGSSNSISSLNFSPDFCWFKSRNQAYHHYLFDSVRGANKAIYSALTNAETTQTDTLMSFDSNGFTLGTDTANGEMNSSGNSFVSWSWRGSDSSAVSNTDGSITSTVSANTTSGFSIVTYSGNGTAGATVGHGLGSDLGLIILKCRDTTGTSWQMYHKSLGATKSINLENTAAAAASINYWNDTAPTSSVFSLGAGGDFNNGSRTYVAYCFAEKQGFSKFGSYTGNGSTDGPFIYTGFKPAWVLLKSSSNAGWNWRLSDNTRDTFNSSANKNLFPSSSDAEVTSEKDVDFLSNGFKLRTSGNGVNASGWTIIYMAFADEPLVGDNPATAR